MWCFHNPESTPEPLYNTVHYNTVLDITRIKVGSQMAILDTFFCMTCAFYSQYNTVWIDNTETGLNSYSSVIKRLWCIFNHFFGIFSSAVCRAYLTGGKSGIST